MDTDLLFGHQHLRGSLHQFQEFINVSTIYGVIFCNQVARRMLHRPLLVYRMPNLHIIDGIPVTEEERTKADLYFMEQQVRHSIL